MKIFGIFGIVFVALNFSGCAKTVSLNEIKNPIKTLNYLHKDDIKFQSNEEDKIKIFMENIINAKLSDETEFKSFRFIKFMDASGVYYRIEVFQNYYRYKRRKYLCEKDIIKYLETTFNYTDTTNIKHDLSGIELD